MANKHVDHHVELLNSILRQDLVSFVAKCFKELNPGKDYSDAWYIDHIVYELERVANDETFRAILAMPPRFGKSTIVSVIFTAWILGRNPALRIICASYSWDLAAKLSTDFRKIVESAWYKKLFPEFEIDAGKCSEREIRTTKNGGRFSTSVGGPTTGLGGDYLILDDIIKADDALSETMRQSAINWMENTAFSRLDDPKKGKIILIGQRLHPDDPIGYLLEKTTWRYICLPLVCQETKAYRLARVGGYVEHVWKAGELLDSHRWDEKSLATLKAQTTTPVYNAQYLQAPQYTGDSYIDWSWFQRFAVPPQFDYLVISVDPANTTNSTSAYSVCMVIGILGEDSYIIQVDRQRVGYELLRARIAQLAEDYRADLVIIESSGVGYALLDSFRSSKEFEVVSCGPLTNKEARMIPVLPVIECGKVSLPEAAPWLGTFRQEIQAFPNSKYKDQVDALSQFLGYRDNVIRRANLNPRHCVPKKRKHDYDHIIGGGWLF